MKLLRNIAIGLVVLVVAVAAIGFLLPREVHVERSVEIAAPQSDIFAVVNDLGQFNSWSPWYALDPDADYEVTGAPGKGQTMTWASENPQVGVGSQNITLSDPDELVETSLDFGPMGTALAFIRLEPAGDGITKVTWGFDTDLGANPLGRYFGLMIDGAVGGDYEKGLARLKSMMEEAA